MASDNSDSEVEASLPNGINGNAHEGDAATDTLDEADDGDLFGDGSDADVTGLAMIKEPPGSQLADECQSRRTSPKRRKLDDEELKSDDDEGRHDRLEDDGMDGYGNEEEDQREIRSQNVADIRVPRHPLPSPSDGELQSNARVIRWEDGSLTVQLASNAREQYALSAKALAPPQTNPRKPVPTAKKLNRLNAGAAPESYDARLDSHTYLVTPHESAQILRITNHITASLAVQSNSVEDDDALIRLQERMAAAKANKTSGEGGVEMLTVKEDPELAKIKAEAAEKEKIKAQRKRQQQEERERDRANRVLGRSGLRTGGYGMGAGLTVGTLESEDGMATTRPSRPNKPRKKPRRRNSEYSDYEDFRSRGRTKEDEYDEDDGFLVGSDEEPEIVDDASEEEEDVELGDEDAEGEVVEEEEERPAKPAAKREATDDGAADGRAKRRRVVEEDEDEE
ncbi:MAG: hypothetical protein LQ343_002124 [Gyalolechia ehrenbergii]|nr:MAG: hypothetical protein LQ343_002124 [Gyalolechia ehrenbergii]